MVPGGAGSAAPCGALLLGNRAQAVFHENLCVGHHCLDGAAPRMPPFGSPVEGAQNQGLGEWRVQVGTDLPSAAASFINPRQIRS